MEVGPVGRFPPRSIRLNGRITSMRLEPEFWDALADVAEREGITGDELVARINRERRPGDSLTPAVRLFLMRYYRELEPKRGRTKGSKPKHSR